MADEATRAAQEEANAAEIKRNEATDSTPRGNVHSEPEEEEPGFQPPPPLPN